MTVPIIVKNLSKTFREHNVLHNISFDVVPGESLVVIGGSGSGKSVLIRCVLGLTLPDRGSIIKLNGLNVSNIPISSRKGDGIGVLFQSNALFDSLRVWENVAFVALQNKVMDSSEAKKMAIEKLSMVELNSNTANLYPSEISGGMQKRVALARTIANNPKLLFFDEPTTGLDPITSKKISDLIKSICAQLKATSVTITHDVTCMQTVGSKVLAISNGTVAWHGDLSEMHRAKHPYIREFFQYSSPHIMDE